MSQILRAARERFEWAIEYLLDDPHGFGTPDEVREVIAETRALAKELGLDYDEAVKAGSSYEQNRLRLIEENK